MDGSIAGAINYQIRRIICSTACRLLLFRSRARPMGFRWRVTYSLDVECPHVFVLTLGWQDDAIEGTRWKRNGNLVRWEEGRRDSFFRFFSCGVVLCVLEVRLAISLLLPLDFLFPLFFFPSSFSSFLLFFFFVAFFLPDTCLLSLFFLSAFFPSPIRSDILILFPSNAPSIIASLISPPLHCTPRTV